MPCVIAAPASGNGKTLLSLLICSWATSKGKSIQTFKVGPDYLDPQQLSLISKKPCRNLDLILCGKDWVQHSFYTHAQKADLTLVEGVMGLFDGLGSSHKGSTAEVSKYLNLPVVLIVNAKGQSASIAALVKGFTELDQQLNIAGVVLNNVNTDRHKKLLTDILDGIRIKVLGCLPTKNELILANKYLGLAPAHEIKDIESKIRLWSYFANKYLDIDYLHKLLLSPSPTSRKDIYADEKISREIILDTTSVAIAQDKAFHFRYPETKEFLEKSGIRIFDWKPTNDEPIPKDVKGLIIPGGYPEQFAEQISSSKRSLKSLQDFFCKKPIYAECGGMLIMGSSMKDINRKAYPMANILPFTSEEANLSVGYRKLKVLKDNLILSKGEELIGHEFHRWKITNLQKKELDTVLYKEDLYHSWNISGWGINEKNEGWANKKFHASWIHLHWPSSKNIISNWIKSVKDNSY